MDDKIIRIAIKLWFIDKEECIKKYGHISRWNTENVTDMSCLFEYKYTFNEQLYWNTENVKTMKRMFYHCYKFNKPLYFDTQNVITMKFMFSHCYKFNQLLMFNTTNVYDMSFMFYFCYHFNQPINFNMQNVIHMDSMFSHCINYNQPINFYCPKLSSITCMFHKCYWFNNSINFNSRMMQPNSNIPLCGINMFYGCQNLNNYDAYNFLLNTSLDFDYIFDHKVPIYKKYGEDETQFYKDYNYMKITILFLIFCKYKDGSYYCNDIPKYIFSFM